MHPRGYHGRFTNTDHLSPYKIRSESEVSPYAIRPHVKATLGRLSHEQRQRALEALSEGGKLKPTLPRFVPALTKRITAKENVTFNDKGLEIWQDSGIGKKDASFKVRVNKHYNYEVTVENKPVSLNRNRNEFEFRGETVKGIPSLHPHLREMKDEDLFKSLAATMTMAESSKPNAPLWDSGLHGQVKGLDWQYTQKTKGAEREAGYYGEMQIHHVGQWSKIDIPEYNRKVLNGELSRDEAQRIFDTNFHKIEGTSKTGKPTTNYVVQIQSRKERSFVVLPAGLHDFSSSLYNANHPEPINPHTTFDKKGHEQPMRPVSVGIPKTGNGGRSWFNDEWKPAFWREVYKRESYVLRGEIQRRIDNSKLPLSEAKQLWENVHREALK